MAGTTYAELKANMPADVPKKWKPVWDAACDALVAFAKNDPHKLASSVPLLPYLYYRFGRDAGATLRLMHADGISWGTYSDKMGVHCNAHANNLVLFPQRHSQRPKVRPTNAIRESSLFCNKGPPRIGARNVMCAAAMGVIRCPSFFFLSGRVCGPAGPRHGFYAQGLPARHRQQAADHL